MFTALDFPVELVKIPHPTLEGEKIQDRKAIIRTDTNRVLNIVSDRYQLVRHSDVFGVMNEAVERLGIPVKDVAVRVGDFGGLAKVEWRLDRTIQIHNGESNVGDLVDLKIIARNSYNYMSGLGLQLGAFRLICTNGMTIGRMLESFYKRHVPSLKVETALNVIVGMLEKQEMVQGEWRRWDNINYPPARLSKWLTEREEFSKKAREEVVDYFQTQPDRTRAGLAPRFTGWEAYNSLTWFGTHRVRTRSENRVLVAQELVDQLADTFAYSELRN